MTQLREDLGKVQYTPTFVFAFFNDDGTEYAKFEGENEITLGMMSGQIDGVINELMKRRTKLKVVDGMAALAAKMMVMRMVGDAIVDVSITGANESSKTVCDICKETHPNPVTYHMKTAHPGCGKDAGGYGYDKTGAYRPGWQGDCGDGGSGTSTWYLMCKECRVRHLARREGKIIPD